MALRNLGVLGQCSLEFRCEIDKWCSSFIMQDHPPRLAFEDITLRDLLVAPPCDLYVAGLPCHPFSRAGLRHGVEDSATKGRGTIFERLLPTCVPASPAQSSLRM
jgi:site-specific DNA-cytosine methylase